MIKNKYKSDYTSYTQTEAGGRIRQNLCYSGTYYCLPLDETEKKKAVSISLLFGLVMLGLTAAAGLINPDSSRTAWIVFPYLFLFLPCVYQLLGAVSLWGAKTRMEKAVYDASIVRMRRSCWGVLVLAAINIVLDILFLALYFDTVNKTREVVYGLCMVMLLLTALAFGRYFDRTFASIQVET